MTFLWILFFIVTFLLGTLILVQQGKGDLGLGSMAGSQMLFGGAGGQEFFVKATWVLGALFILGALGISILRTKYEHRSSLSGYVHEARKQ